MKGFLDGSGSGRNDEEQKKKTTVKNWKKKIMSSFHSLSSFSIFCAEALWGLKVKKPYDLDLEECKMHLKTELLANHF